MRGANCGKGGGSCGDTIPMRSCTRLRAGWFLNNRLICVLECLLRIDVVVVVLGVVAVMGGGGSGNDTAKGVRTHDAAPERRSVKDSRDCISLINVYGIEMEGKQGRAMVLIVECQQQQQQQVLAGFGFDAVEILRSSWSPATPVRRPVGHCRSWRVCSLQFPTPVLLLFA